jgi:hypothetical protein
MKRTYLITPFELVPGMKLWAWEINRKINIYAYKCDPGRHDGKYNHYIFIMPGWRDG